eukprot:162109-Pyramimonas_sp.AAC.1
MRHGRQPASLDQLQGGSRQEGHLLGERGGPPISASPSSTLAPTAGKKAPSSSGGRAAVGRGAATENDEGSPREPWCMRGCRH